MNDKVLIGHIIGFHGVKGELKVKPSTDDPKRFEALTSIYIDLPMGCFLYDIDSVRYHKKLILLKLKNINNKNDAQKFFQGRCMIKKKDRMPLPPDRFYIDDLIGLTVLENGHVVGTLVDVLQPGANDVYVVEDDGDQMYIPALKSVIKTVDIDRKQMIVTLPKGLR